MSKATFKNISLDDMDAEFSKILKEKGVASDIFHDLSERDIERQKINKMKDIFSTQRDALITTVMEQAETPITLEEAEKIVDNKLIKIMSSPIKKEVFGNEITVKKFDTAIVLIRNNSFLKVFTGTSALTGSVFTIFTLLSFGFDLLNIRSNLSFFAGILSLMASVPVGCLPFFIYYKLILKQKREGE